MTKKDKPSKQEILAKVGELALENEQLGILFKRNSQIVEALKQQLIKLEGKKNERP